MDRIRYLLGRLRERLWIKPLAVCVASVAAALLAKVVDGTQFGRDLPIVSSTSVEDLLQLVAASMLVMATLAVGSMVAAYTSAASTATPRAFPLVVSDDVSQNALSAFTGAFIFCVVAFISLTNGYYASGGRFVLFIATIAVLAFVLATFVRWVDRIARLGRLSSVIEKVESATAKALQARRGAPNLGGTPWNGAPGADKGRPVYADTIGYVHYIDMGALQKWAEQAGATLEVLALPGTFTAPGRPLACIVPDAAAAAAGTWETSEVVKCFHLGRERTFDQDPRFGLVVLSEIASRALSPAINDTGTAVQVIGTLVRLFAGWAEPAEAGDAPSVLHARVHVAALDPADLFTDAFAAIERDGAGAVEVGVRLQKALTALATLGNAGLRTQAQVHSQRAMRHARRALHDEADLQVLEASAARVTGAFPSPRVAV